ncbi:penicillin-binding protein 2 [Patescibacteria group bacterium]|nr:penicillin-binding protein 2 [Patescibacteria group bacterium]
MKLLNIKKNNDDLFVVKTYGKIVKNKYIEHWTHGSILPTALGISKVRPFFSYLRTNIVLLFFFLLIGLLIARLIWLQIIMGNHYYDLAQGNRVRLERIEAKRGIIYDSKMRPLVQNVANFLLYFVPADLPRDRISRFEILLKLNTILENEFSIDDMEAMISQIQVGSLKSFQPLFLTDSIKYEAAMKILLESKKWPGVILTNKTRREYYLHNLSMSHILGYTGKINNNELEDYGSLYNPIDYIGKVGIEFFWEPELRGLNGQKQIEVDALGKEKRIIKEIKPEDGSHLILSIDVVLQSKIEEITKKHLEKIKTNRAVVIALNPNNGEVMALVNIPSYNNNAFARGISLAEYRDLINHEDNPLFNRAISGEYPSGSTIKPVMIAAALQEKVISEYTSFLSVGGIRISSWYFPDWKAGGHGIVDARRALAESVNTFFYYIGGGYKDFEGLGVKRIVQYGKLFGLSEQTGIDLAGEASGFLPSIEWKLAVKGEPWYIGDTYHLAIGQGDVLVTPLQVALFTSAFANDGKLYRPHIVSKVLSSADGSSKPLDTAHIRENFIDSYNIKIVKEGMRQAVTKGSARRLSLLGVTSAGKTGTAQWSSKKETHAWFTGFAPYINPEMVLTILIEEGGEGSEAAVPIAYDIWEWYFNK